MVEEKREKILLDKTYMKRFIALGITNIKTYREVKEEEEVIGVVVLLQISRENLHLEQVLAQGVHVVDHVPRRLVNELACSRAGSRDAPLTTINGARFLGRRRRVTSRGAQMPCEA